jgi:hypothetical protein
VSESLRRNLFVALCALVLLHTGVHLSQSFINYPGWYVLEAESFRAYHAPMSIRAMYFGAAPRFLELVLALVILRFPPHAVPRRTLLVGIALATGALLSTALIQRPIHVQLGIQGNTPELVSRLLATDWIRNVLEWGRTALYVWLLSRLIAPDPSGRPAS